MNESDFPQQHTSNVTSTPSTPGASVAQLHPSDCDVGHGYGRRRYASFLPTPLANPLAEAFPGKTFLGLCCAVAIIFTPLALANPAPATPQPARSSSSTSVQPFVHPVTGSADRHTMPAVLRPYAPPAQRWLRGHRGVDVDAPIGAPIFAAGEGTVLFVGTIAGTGVVSIEHADGLRTTYQPVTALVTKGEHVAQGQQIATLSAPTDGYPGLHWGAKYGADDYINPLSLLRIGVIRLKPV